jgi:4-amino-4-deoxy-L-arabinose transferase-like glycosyltransferase
LFGSLINRKARLFDIAAPVLFGILLLVFVPIRTSLQLGSDEGYELMKGWLVSLGHRQYAEIWNDQPPLHTQILGTVFELFGPSAFVGRLINIAFSILLFSSVYRRAKELSGRPAAVLSCALLCSASPMIELTSSVMLEVPVVSLSLTALLFWSRYLKTYQLRHFVLALLFTVCAFATKLTAALFLPTYFTYFLLRSDRERSPLPRSFRMTLFLVASVLVILASFHFFSFADAIRVAYRSHFTGAPDTPAGWDSRFLLNETPLVLSTSLGLLFIWRKCWLPEFSMLVSGLVFSLIHHPFWYYYAIYLIVPMAIIGSSGPTRAYEACRFLVTNSLGELNSRFWRSVSVLCVFTYMAIAAFAVSRIEPQILSLSSPRFELTTKISALRSVPDVTWVFTDDPMAAFWAQIPIPPPLAVMPPKRFWSHQVGSTEVIAYLKEYRPEVIMVPGDWIASLELGAFISKYYRQKSDVDVENFFVIRSLDATITNHVNYPTASASVAE